MIKKFAFATGLALLFSAATTSVQAGSPVVVELFTSQGCSSCPPADKVLTELLEQDDVIALSWSVDYWDYLGWKDTHASAANTMRQRAYNDYFGRRIIYTPQMVLDGKAHMVGSNRSQVMRAVDNYRSNDTKTNVRIERDAQGHFKAHVDEAQLNEGAIVRMVWFDDEKTVDIGRGENSGRELTYHNVVRGSQVIGEYDGSAASFDLPMMDAISMDCDAVVILVQADPAGPIIGAAQTRLN